MTLISTGLCRSAVSRSEAVSCFLRKPARGWNQSYVTSLTAVSDFSLLSASPPPPADSVFLCLMRTVFSGDLPQSTYSLHLLREQFLSAGTRLFSKMNQKTVICSYTVGQTCWEHDLLQRCSQQTHDVQCDQWKRAETDLCQPIGLYSIRSRLISSHERLQRKCLNFEDTEWNHYFKLQT